MTFREPRLQNIPVKSELGRKIREGFLFEDKLLFEVDYSSLERTILERMYRNG